MGIACLIFISFLISFFSFLTFLPVVCLFLILQHTENLGNMVPDKYYSMYHFSHPPLVERLRELKLKDDALDSIRKLNIVKGEAKKDTKKDK
jgi:hypothetical protein